MKKVFFLLLIGLCFGSKMQNVQAQTVRTSVSHGNLIYEENRKSAALYTSDIHLLEDKISTIPERCFDPVSYAHTHEWEYRRINEKTHTRHCADCGESNDLTSSHRADSWERNTITYQGKAYPGKRYTCACGYQWSMELSHTMIFEAVDEVNHHGRCALDGTPYCLGFEPTVEEHYAWYYEMGDDAFHHQKICYDCEFRIEETCRLEEAESDESRRVCICGRSAEEEESEPSEASDESVSEDPPGTTDEPETGDPPEAPDEPGSEDSPEPPDEPGNEDAPESPGESGNEDVPGTPDESENEDTPGTTDEPESPDPPEAAQTEELKYGLINKFYIKTQKEDFAYHEKI